VNKFRKVERHSGLLAFLLSGLFYVATGSLVFFVTQHAKIDSPPAMGPKAVNLSFAQMELRAAAPASAQPVPPPPEMADVAPEEIKKAPEPEIKPAPAVEQTTQMDQEASVPQTPVIAAVPLAGSPGPAVDWRAMATARLCSMIEYEKSYPEAARRAGYTGRVNVYIHLEPDGAIAGYEIKERRGHPLLGKAVETTMEKIKGRNIGLILPERFNVLLPVEFELK
jgi:TonB family protein